MQRVRRLRQRVAQAVYREWRPALPATEKALHAALHDRLAAEDSPDKAAIVIGGSVELAYALGLRKARLLVLDFPHFTIENLALLEDNYDFVIANRALHRCENLADAVSETFRVLRPGGWFVHTTSLLDQAIGLPWQLQRFGQRGLARLFSDGAGSLTSGTAGAAFWAMGQKSADVPSSPATVATRKAVPRWYPASPSVRPARFGVVAAARNEAPYLLEWIAHYRVLGFELISIYDNESNDASWRILAPLAKAGIVEAIYWPNRPRQHKQQSAYNHARLRLRDALDWCLIVDLDEFLILQEGLTVEDIVPRDPEVSAIAIPWRIFGSSGLRRRETGLTIERFRRAAATNHPSSKTLMRLRDVEWMHTHWPRLSHGRMINIAGKPFDQDETVDGPARLHHYFSRSWEEFECKRARGMGIGPKGAMRPQSIFFEHDENEIVLDDALRLAAATRAEVERLERIVRG